MDAGKVNRPCSSDQNLRHARGRKLFKGFLGDSLGGGVVGDLADSSQVAGIEERPPSHPNRFGGHDR